MKILHLAPHCDDTGNGVVNVAIDLACVQAREGHSVVFASPGGSFVSLLDDCLVSHVDLPNYRLYSAPRILWRLRQLVSAFNPDIVHAHMIPGALLARLARGRLPFRLVTTVHNGPLFRTLLMGVGDLAIAVSHAMAAEMGKRGFPARKLRVVQNGPLDSPRRGLWKDSGTEEPLDYPAIVTVAGLFAYKGIADLIEAFSLIASRAPTAKLYILGDGTARAEFEQAAAAKDCADRIVFCGFVRDPRPYLRNADLFVLVSHREAFGLVLAEAREAGCAIVASNVGGIPEVLDKGSAGILVPPRSPEILAEVLLDLLGNDEQRRLWRSRASSNLEWLNVRRVCAETLAVYRESLAGSKLNATP